MMADKKKETQDPEKKDDWLPEFKRDTKLNIYQRLNLIMAETHVLTKDKRVTYKTKDGAEFEAFSVITSDQVDAMVQPLLIKYGVHFQATVTGWTANGNSVVVDLDAKWINIDQLDDFFVNHWAGEGIDKGDKALGKATTYAVRFAKVKTLNIPSKEAEVEDDDSQKEGDGARSGTTSGGKTTGAGKKGNPEKLINESQVGKIRAKITEFDPPSEMVGEWMAAYGKDKFDKLTNAEMDNLLEKITSGAET